MLHFHRPNPTAIGLSRKLYLFSNTITVVNEVCNSETAPKVFGRFCRMTRAIAKGPSVRPSVRPATGEPRLTGSTHRPMFCTVRQNDICSF